MTGDLLTPAYNSFADPTLAFSFTWIFIFIFIFILVLVWGEVF